MTAARTFVAVVAVVACMAMPTAAADSRESPPPIGAPRPVTIAEPFLRTLHNGLRVVVMPRRGLPLVTAELVVRTGTEADPGPLAGLAHLTATLLTKGTTRRTAPRIAEAAEALGGELASGADWHRSMLTLTVTRPQLARALDLLADVARHPTFAAAELERARRQALDALSVALAQPGSVARMAADRAAFGGSTYGHPPHGTPASLARIRRSDVVALHARHFRPDNATLVFAGDIDTGDAVRLAEAAFGGWRKPPSPLPAVAVTPAQPTARNPIVVDMRESGQAGIVVAMPSIARGAPDYYPGVVANALLEAGYSSRLNQEIRIKRGLSYSAGSELDARRAGGVFAASAQTRNAAAAEVLALILDEIEKVRREPAPADELEARKLALIGGVSRSLETTEGLASRLALLESNGIDVAEVVHVIDRIAQVTPQQVQAYAEAHWRRGDLRVVIAGEAAQFIDAVQSGHPGTLVIGQADVDLDEPGLVRSAPTTRDILPAPPPKRSLRR